MKTLPHSLVKNAQAICRFLVRRYVYFLASIFLLENAGCVNHCLKAIDAYNNSYYDIAKRELSESDKVCDLASAQVDLAIQIIERASIAQRKNEREVLGDYTLILDYREFPSFRPNAELERIVESARKKVETAVCEIVQNLRVQRRYREILGQCQRYAKYLSDEVCVQSIKQEATSALSYAQQRMEEAERYYNNGVQISSTSDLVRAIQICNEIRAKAPEFQVEASQLINRCEEKMIVITNFTVDKYVEHGMELLNGEYAGDLKSEKMKYEEAYENFKKAYDILVKNPEITRDTGPIKRRMDLAKKSMERAEKAISDSANYIAKGGIPLAPLVIDMSTNDKISAKGEGIAGGGEKSKRQGVAEVKGFRYFEACVPQDFLVQVFRNASAQGPTNDVVDKTYAYKNGRHYGCEDFEAGNFYVLISKSGSSSRYSLECTIYKSIYK